MTTLGWPALLPVVLFAGGCSARALDPRLGREDRVAHFAAGLVVGAATRAALDAFRAEWRPWQRAIAAMAAGTVVGLAKEAWDQAGHGDPDAGDAYATSLGGAAGAVAIDLAWRF